MEGAAGRQEKQANSYSREKRENREGEASACQERSGSGGGGRGVKTGEPAVGTTCQGTLRRCPNDVRCAVLGAKLGGGGGGGGGGGEG